MKKILGIGNALEDVLVQLENDAILSELGISKGSMQLIDADKRAQIFNRISGMQLQFASGGSASNTLLALAKLGVEAGFIGKIGNDEYAELYFNAIKEAGVTPYLYKEEAPSGTAITFISPEGERTFGTYLGAASNLVADELQEALFRSHAYFYIEGYLVQNYQLIETAVKMAKAQGCLISLDLASYNVVEENREFLFRLIEEYVDIVFANEEEAKALTGKDARKSVLLLASKVQIAVVKMGSQGSLVMQGDTLVHVPAIEVRMVDSTAAGDFYAAGFFYGLMHQLNLEQCGKIGTILASNVIQVVGTRLPESTWKRIRSDVKAIQQNEEYKLLF